MLKSHRAIRWRNESLQSLTGLEPVREVAGGIDLWRNPVLDDIGALRLLTAIGSSLYEKGGSRLTLRSDLPLGRDAFPDGGDLRLADCPRLSDLHGLSSLRVIGGRLDLEELPVLNSLEGMLALNIVGGSLTIRGCGIQPPFDTGRIRVLGEVRIS